MTIVQCILTHPELKDLEIGSKDWFTAQQAMIRSKPLVKRCYDLWYRKLLDDADSVPSAGTIVELGSGSSYVKQLRPDVVTSDCAPGIADMVIDGRSLPFPDASVRAILLTHVFHHIPDVGLFLEEASRVLVPGGVIAMVDETHTPFAKFFFSKIHPEPYDDLHRRAGRSRRPIRCSIPTRRSPGLFFFGTATASPAAFHD